jgi:outer membrane protein assembly factor BamB
VNIGSLRGFFSSPTVYNGVVYIGARNGYFYALDETTGAIIWSTFVGQVTYKTCGSEGFASTATVAPDPTTGNPTVYVYGPTGYLYALNAADGSEVWPPAQVAIPSPTQNDYYAWSSPLVLDGNVYVGVSSQCTHPLVRGALDEFSQASGAFEHTFWTTPEGTVGGGIWSSAATDGSSVFVSTGSGQPDTSAQSIIQFSPSLTKLSKWVLPSKDRIFDSDFGASPGLWTASINGVPTEMIGACNKNGTFYALQASALRAGPVWSLPIGGNGNKGPGECLAAPLFDGTNLYLASNVTTIGGTTYDGSVRAVDPGTGDIIWQDGLSGPIMGTPGLDGAGVIAAATYWGQNDVYLIDASTGQILNTLSYGSSKTFAQPVFADDYLFVASTDLGLQVYTAG